MTTVPAVDRPEEGRNILAEVQNRRLALLLKFHPNLEVGTHLQYSCIVLQAAASSRAA